MNGIRIGDQYIGPDHKPFIIAEMSGNHNQSLEQALKIVDAAAECGVSALKIQTYTADTMTLDVEADGFQIKDRSSLWAGKSLYQLYGEAHTPWDWHKAIFERCKSHGIIGFSSPFDESAVDFLETLNVPAYKIASFENADIPLIKKVASTGKPMIISTGMASLSELDDTVRVAREAGCKDLILLKCTSTYPASPEDTNLRTIPHMRDLFQCIVGLSDHTLGIGAAIASVAYGASVIEKHFTLSRTDGGIDAVFSLEPSELQCLVKETERAWLALGRVNYGATAAELSSIKFRRSIYVARDMKRGDVLSPESVRIIRPGYGLSPKYYDLVVGRKLSMDVEKGTPLTWEILQ